MPREGPLDPLFGQRAVFPREGLDPKIGQWLENVRMEALSLDCTSRSPRGPDGTPAQNRRPAPHGLAPSIYENESQVDIATLQRITFEGTNIGLPHQRDLLTLWRGARHLLFEAPKTSNLADFCETQAAWKTHVASNRPPSFDVSVDHVTVFRLVRYLAHWSRQRNTAPYSLWAWSLILRCPELLTAEEIGLLRDLARILSTTPIHDDNVYESQVATAAFKELLITQYGQRDL